VGVRTVVWTVALASFLASSVEFVEALTIVLAVGTVKGYRLALRGTLLAVLALAVLVAVLGLAVLRFVPLGVLKGVIGTLLLLFGLKWLRKAILRFAGRKALHDEAQAFVKEQERLRQSDVTDFEATATAFNGVFLEGLEVVVIVLTMGSAAAAHAVAMPSAVLGALVGLVVVLSLGLVLRAPLTRVPENVMKFVVGIMLTTFGTFWAGEALGVRWPGADLTLIGLIVVYLLASRQMVTSLKRERPAA
jgi:uncharacterized membrane protein